MTADLRIQIAVPIRRWPLSRLAHMKPSILKWFALGVALVLGCAKSDELKSSAMLGKWMNAGVDDNTIEFRDDGTVSIVGDTPENRLDGRTSFWTKRISSSI
jgi:hypothetical protein